MSQVSLQEPAGLILYHGARRWDGPAQVLASRKGRYECGPGIYLTTNAQTAGKYAKGGGMILRMRLDPNITWLESARIDLDVAMDFVKNLPRVPCRKDILLDLQSNAKRMKSESLHANILVNLMVNYDALGASNGPALAAWLTEQGIDASLHSANGMRGYEDWVIVFNPAIICGLERLRPSQIDWSQPQLPDVRDQLAALAPMSVHHDRPKARG